MKDKLIRFKPVLTLLIVTYLLLTTGYLTKSFKFLPWNPWFQFSAEILLVLLWLTTGAVISSFTCTDVCNACPNYYYIDSCLCYSNIDTSQKGKSYGSTLEKEVFQAADKIGLDWTMFVLVLISLIFTSYLLWREKHPQPATEGEVETVAVETKTADAPTQPPAQVQSEVPYQAPPQPTATQVPPMGYVQTDVQATPTYQAAVPNPAPEYHGPGPNAVTTPEYHP